MSKPKSLQVYGTKYRLKNSKTLLKAGIVGHCDPDKKTISIDSSLDNKEYCETVLHELFHAVFFECSINQAVSPDLEEVIVDLLSRSVLQNFNLKSKADKKRSK